MADENPPSTASGGNTTDSGTDSQEGASLDGTDSANTSAATAANLAEANTSKAPKKGGLKAIFKKFSIYLLLFVLVIIIAVMVVVIAYMRGHTKANNPITSQTLSQGGISQLSKSDVTVGDVKQTLSVQSNAVFAGQVLIRKDLQVAGKLSVGGNLSLTGITVTGNSVVDQLQINKNLQVAGETAFQGQVTIQKGLSVSGGGTFNGPLSAPQLTVNTLQISGDLALTHHISAGGATPGRSNGNALGGGGTASVSGSDTAGTITINTGGSPSAGCFVTINFSTKFNSTPHVVVTPIEAGAASLQYYVTRSTSSFSVCSTNAAPSGQTFGFDYIIFD